jgi:NADPH:quinone reductase-like Zn-dependent oxidoreductase
MNTATAQTAQNTNALTTNALTTNAQTTIDPLSLTDQRTMKAITREHYGSAENLQLQDLEIPKISDDQVLVRVHAAGLDRGAWHLMTGKPYLIRMVGYGLQKPKNITLGLDLAGVVQAVGKNVSRFKPGDRVFGIGNGSFAEYASARADKLAIMPANTSFEQAAAVPVSAMTALQAVRDHGRVQAGQRVLISGASGGVGSYAVQIAKVFGAHVTGVCSTAKIDLVRSIGADEVIDYTRTDFTNSLERYDVVLDIGGGEPLAKLRRLLTETGTLALIGAEGGNAWTGTMNRVLQAALLAPFSRQRLVSVMNNENARDLEVLAKMIEQGAIKPVIDRTCSLANLPDAMRDLEAGRVRGKVVVAIAS